MVVLGGWAFSYERGTLEGPTVQAYPVRGDGVKFGRKEVLGRS